MSLSGLVEIPRPFDVGQGRLQEKRGFVMPAKAGIHLGSWQGKEDLDFRLYAGMTKGRVDF